MHRVRQEVCVDEHRVGRAEGRVGLEEERRRDLRTASACVSCALQVDLLWAGVLLETETYISRFALFSSSFFLASVSPAIWFFFLQCGVSVSVTAEEEEGWRSAVSHTVLHRAGLAAV